VDAAKSVTAISLLFALLTAAIFLLVPGPLIWLFLDTSKPDAESVAAYAIPLLFVAAGFQLADTLQVLANGLLRGIKDTRMPMIIAALSYWGFGLSAAYVFGFVMDLGGVGIWSGLALGLGVAALLLNIR